MSRNEPVSPLRINKAPNNASPTKAFGRPLADISTTERRRNSPSFNQTTKTIMFSKESSPFDSSPLHQSPRLFWKEQTTSPKARFGSENEFENDASSLSPKRSSIENLKKASRVKNSSMFAREQKHEYDPASVQPLDRPLAAGRPLSTQIQGNAFQGSGLAGLRKQNDDFRGHRRGESLPRVPLLSPTKTSPGKLSAHSSFSSPPKDMTPPPEGRVSPSKSALVSPARSHYPEYNQDSSVLFTDDEELTKQTPRPLLRRHAKSVTFDAAPPTINEYEMVTPDLSVASVSREGSYDTDEDDAEVSFDQDDSFDASLEDTDKTPVVLPEDWRHMSPEEADTSLVDDDDDVFEARENSPVRTAKSSRSGSMASDGESRPLPPLPGMQADDSDRRRRDSNTGLSAVAERPSPSRRLLPQLPPAPGFSKSDLLNMQEESMSLEDRLSLMNIEYDRNADTPTQEHHEVPDQVEIKIEEQAHDMEDGPESHLTVDGPKAPRISRESILRKVKSHNFDEYEPFNYDSPDRSYGELADLDPDVPIPSRECSSNFDEHPHDPHEISEIPEEDEDSVLDAYSMVEQTEVYPDASPVDDYEREGSVIHHEIRSESPEADDDASQYSSQPEELPTSQSTIETSGPSTPSALNSSPTAAEKEARRDELFASFNNDHAMDLSLDPLKSSFETAPSPLDTAPKIGAMREFLRRPETPEAYEDAEVEEPGTPDSVIRHPTTPDITVDPSADTSVDTFVVIEPPKPDSPAVPEEFATIRGAGGRLKTRPSLIPGDIDMAATRRQVSGSHPPPVPVRSPKRQSLSLEIDHVGEWDSRTNTESSNKENRMLDIAIGDESNDLGFGLDKEFDHIIEAQKKGYLMRQNTKVVVASSRAFSDEKPAGDVKIDNGTTSANHGPRKTSEERKPAWTAEPWNGKARRRSLRTASGTRRLTSGPAPPLPGQESAVASGLDAVEEQGAEEDDEGIERGRLFVKVIGVKDLDLPLPKTERSYFQLTLDNGLHCVTTSWLELGYSAPIGQEFELVVLDDLEFQLTLQTKLEPPVPVRPVVTAAPVKAVNHKKSNSTFRNFLSSPKKRKEQERKEKEEAERLALQQEKEAAQAKRSQQTTAWDLLHNLVGPDGSFARAYVCLKNHESEAYGRPLVVDIPCFNEWAVDDSGPSSVKSKRGGVVRRPPYRVGKLTLQLLYVPKPKDAKDDDMPKSMNACIRELKEAEEVKAKQWEGHLSQQGGDCPYWRRRFFRLDGTKLTAYHETTRQPRVSISLAKATKLIDDKTALQQPASTKTGGRRKSAFAEEEEGYMFVEEGFRIRFANGEVIDFYADTAAQKDEWMAVLSETIGKDATGSKAWTKMVLDKERREKRSQVAPQLAQAKALQEQGYGAPQARPQSHNGVGSKSVPTSPIKGHARTKSHDPRTQLMGPPPPIEKDPRHKNEAIPRKRDVGQPGPPVQPGRRGEVRSMIF